MPRSKTVPRHAVFVFFAAVFILCSFAVVSPVSANELKADEGASQSNFGEPVSIEAADALEIEQVEQPLAETTLETHSLLKAEAGYRFISIDGNGSRAAEFSDLHSGPTGSLLHSVLGRDHKLIIDGSFLSDNDYYGDLSYDFMGAYRVHLRSESLFHNLENLPLFSPSPIIFPGSSYTATPKDTAQRYGIRVEQDLASMRARLGTYPIHFNLQYWRMTKEGNSQLRFADQSFFPNGTALVPYPNKVISQERSLHSETHEGKIGFDAHLGAVDLIYDFTIRQLNNHAGTPVDSFVSRIDPVNLQFQRGAGNFEHNEPPDSRYLSHTVKLHTEQTGGIVAAAAYTFSQRSNRSSLSQVSGANGLTDLLHTAIGDLVYTPCKEFSLAVRFRHQEIDHDTATIVMPLFTPSTLYAYNGIDTQRDIISTILSFRPVTDYTVKAEYRGEITHRNNVNSWSPIANNVSGMMMPGNEEKHSGSLTFLARPIKGLRVKVRYGYTVDTQPAYGNSFDERHDGQFLVNYSIRDRWGISANYLNFHEYNDSKSINNLTAFVTPLREYPISREKNGISATSSLWANFFGGRLNLTATGGLLKNSTDQEVLFTGTTSSTTPATNYTSRAILYGITAGLRPLDRLDLSLAFQQVHSFAEFDPRNNPTVGGNVEGVKELSWLKSVENSVSFKADYALYKNVSCGVDYRYRGYNDERNPIFDGSVHSVVASMTAKW